MTTQTESVLFKSVTTLDWCTHESRMRRFHPLDGSGDRICINCGYIIYARESQPIKIKERQISHVTPAWWERKKQLLKRLEERNREIYQKRLAGTKVAVLAEEYGLTAEFVRRIVRRVKD